MWATSLQKNVIKGTAENLSVTVDAHNRLNTGGYVYDTAGNLTSDTFHTLTFNAENQATPGSGTTYVYDGDGRRVNKTATGLYWVDDNFQPLTLTDGSGNPQKDFIFFGGMRAAMVVTCG